MLPLAAASRRGLHSLLPRRPVKAQDLPPLPSHCVVHSTSTTVEKKSRFQGRAVRAKSVEEVRHAP